jgi:aryl-alcohol dehydrogenase-like predicted oxidoreductase
LPEDPTIARRRFGRTDLVVSEFGLGCARIGGIFQRDSADFLNLLSAAFDAGINFFDTADIYTQGESERLLGRAFRGRRDQIVIASKAGFVLPAQRSMVARLKPVVRPVLRLLKLRRHHLPNALRGSLAQDFSPLHLNRVVEGTLRRLATDRLDLFQLHSPPTTIIEQGDWLAVLDRLKREGKIRYYGISCDSTEAAVAALGHPSVSSIQLVINLLERRAIDVLQPARAQGTGVIARECLANGLLAKDTATVNVASYCQSSDEAERKTMQIEIYRRAAVANGSTLAHVALQFVNQLKGVSVTLVGLSSLLQLRALVSTGILGPRRAKILDLSRVV